MKVKVLIASIIVAVAVVTVGYLLSSRGSGGTGTLLDVIPSNVLRTTTSAPVEPVLPVPPPRPEELISCFDHYRFGSVPALITSDLASVSQSSSLPLTIKVTNENDYPIVDAAVYIKLLYKRHGAEKDVNGPDVLALIPVGTGITLKAGETKTLQYVWSVPPALPPGDYRVASFVAASDRFNLLGLTFTDDVIGNIYDFTVVGEDVGVTRFRKDGVTISGLPYHFAAFMPSVDPRLETVPVSAAITNSRASGETVEVAWSVYGWDSLREATLLTTGTSEVSVAANGEAIATYNVRMQGDRQGVYLVVGEFTDALGNPSRINIRMTRGFVNVPRFNFVAAAAYPATEGTLAFACFHSTGQEFAENSKVILRAKGPFGTIASASYKGIIPGEIVALTAPFTGAATSFDLTAELYQNGKKLDEITVKYRCEDFGEKCPMLPFGLGPILLFGGAGLLVVIVGAVLWYAFRKRISTSLPTP